MITDRSIVGMATPTSPGPWPSSSPRYVPTPVTIGLSELGEAKTSMIAADGSPSFEPTRVRPGGYEPHEFTGGGGGGGEQVHDLLEAGGRPAPLSRRQFGGPGLSDIAVRPQLPPGPPSPPGLQGGTAPRALPPAPGMAELLLGGRLASQFTGAAEGLATALKL